jgi:DNA-binding CsgD family transcriptional regulator
MTPLANAALCVPLNPPLVGAVASMIGAIGSATWFERVLDLLGAVCAADSGGVMLYQRNQRPLSLLHRFDQQERALPRDAYLSGPYALDPHYQLFANGCPSGVYWLDDIAPDDFYQSEYFRLFYSQIGLSDSIDLQWRIDNDTALDIFIERSIRKPKFDAGDVMALELLLPIVTAAAAQHHAQTAAALRRDADRQTHLKVQHTIAHFGSSVLTRREREVLFYMISGYSSALTAERLATSEGTIKNHRKNIHRKLDIGSQAELFSLFIQCIPFAQTEGNSDPLRAYQSRPVAGSFTPSQTNAASLDCEKRSTT